MSLSPPPHTLIINTFLLLVWTVETLHHSVRHMRCVISKYPFCMQPNWCYAHPCETQKNSAIDAAFNLGGFAKIAPLFAGDSTFFDDIYVMQRPRLIMPPHNRCR